MMAFGFVGNVINVNLKFILSYILNLDPILYYLYIVGITFVLIGNISIRLQKWSKDKSIIILFFLEVFFVISLIYMFLKGYSDSYKSEAAPVMLGIFISGVIVEVINGIWNVSRVLISKLNKAVKKPEDRIPIMIGFIGIVLTVLSIIK